MRSVDEWGHPGQNHESWMGQPATLLTSLLEERQWSSASRVQSPVEAPSCGGSVLSPFQGLLTMHGWHLLDLASHLSSFIACQSSVHTRDSILFILGIDPTLWFLTCPCCLLPPDTKCDAFLHLANPQEDFRFQLEHPFWGSILYNSLPAPQTRVKNPFLLQLQHAAQITGLKNTVF